MHSLSQKAEVQLQSSEYRKMHPSNQHQEVNENEATANTCLCTEVKRSVTFFPKVAVHAGLHLGDYSREEKNSCYYNESDYRAFKEETSYTASLVERNVTLDEEFYCGRGVEYRTIDGANQRRKNKYIALLSVLQEQEIQYEEGIIDEQRIATAYQGASYSSKMSAYLLGMTDSKMAKEEENCDGSSPAKKTVNCSVEREPMKGIRTPRRLSSAAA